MKAVIALLLLTAATPALAEDVTTNGSTSGAQAANNVNVIAAGGLNPADTTVRNTGHVWSTPNIQGSVFSGANQCMVGKSVGAAGGPIGVSFGSSKSDEGCDTRLDVNLWAGLGRFDVAITRFCQRQENADAWYGATGEVCPGVDPTRYKRPDGTLPPVSVIDNSSLRKTAVTKP